MRQDAEADTGATWATDDDPRITRVGKFLRTSRLDEIPQLWCVLKGDMHFVGPRPERPEFVEWLSRRFPTTACATWCGPGITGWAQVQYKYGNTLEDAREKLQYDLFYIKNASVGLDFLILFQTIKIVLAGPGCAMRWIFWAAASLIAYTYLGYTAGLWLRARLFPWPVRRAPQEPHISIVMVVRNEDRVLETKLRNLLALDYPAELCQIVVVSDGSTDRTEAILREYTKNPRVQAVMNQLSSGKASGLNDAFEWSQGEIVVFTDARQTIEPGALRLLVENFADPEVGCVSGELMLGDPATGEAKQGMGLYWRIEKNVRELESASGSVVGATGAFYAVRRELLAPLPVGTILDDVYIPLQVARQGRRVVFEPLARAWDSPDLGSGLEFSRKVRTLSGNYQLVQMEPWVAKPSQPGAVAVCKSQIAASGGSVRVGGDVDCVLVAAGAYLSDRIGFAAGLLRLGLAGIGASTKGGIHRARRGCGRHFYALEHCGRHRFCQLRGGP